MHLPGVYVHGAVAYLIQISPQNNIHNSYEYEMRDEVQGPSVQWTFLIKINSIQSYNYEKVHTVKEPSFYFSN